MLCFYRGRDEWELRSVALSLVLDSGSTISSTGSEDHPSQFHRTRPRTLFGELALRPDLGDEVPMVYLPVENGRLQIIISVF